MKEEHLRDTILVLYLLVILVLTLIYFIVPERGIILNNAIEWWAGFFKMDIL
jgi:hypothetical protein